MTHTYSLRLSSEAWEALETIKQRDGMPFAEQLRRAVDQWIAQKTAQHPVLAKTGGAR